MCFMWTGHKLWGRAESGQTGRRQELKAGVMCTRGSNTVTRHFKETLNVYYSRLMHSLRK